MNPTFISLLGCGNSFSNVPLKNSFFPRLCSLNYLRFNEYMNYIINFRVSDIERWRKQLEKTLNEVNAEIGVLQEAKESCERAFEAKALPHDVTTGCKRNSIPKSTFFHFVAV